jgi:hypothetical protein
MRHQAAGFGWYDWTWSLAKLTARPSTRPLFGLGQDDEFQLDADQVPIYVHPDDRALVREATRESRDPLSRSLKQR